MSANAKAIADALSAGTEATAPPEGFDWIAVNYSRYSQAARDGSPTLYMEYGYDGETQMVYLVGQHQLAPEVVS